MQRRKSPLVAFGVPFSTAGQLAIIGAGRLFFVDTVNGNDRNRGSVDAPFATVAKFLEIAEPDDVCGIRGTVREQLTQPLGVTGLRFVGAVGGQTRHDGGARWTTPASGAANAPLITLREQGCEFHNLLMSPKAGYSAIRAHRAESASYPDSSHFICRNVKFVGPGAYGTSTGFGIEDWGGNHHYLVDGCEFVMLEFGVVAPAGSPGIAAPLRNRIRNSRFRGNKHDICMDGNECEIEANWFMDKYHAATHPNTVNLAYTSDASGRNFVIDNIFADAAADVTIAKGYKPSTGDVWRNKVANTAADIVAVPA